MTNNQPMTHEGIHQSLSAVFLHVWHKIKITIQHNKVEFFVDNSNVTSRLIAKQFKIIIHFAATAK